MKVGIARESARGETRVAAVPETVKRLCSEGVEVLIEAGAGQAALLRDDDYQAAGARVSADAAALCEAADVVLKVTAPACPAETDLLRPGTVLIAVLAPTANPEMVRSLADRQVTSFSLDAIPRITRAQSMDVLSSMSTIAGYKAALLAADELGKMVPMMMTAAGTIRPAGALVIGAGVAGLQAIATAKRLGAVVTGVDVRPAAAEQVESLGAKFVAMEAHHEAEDAGGYATDLGEEFYRAEQEILAPHVRQADIVISTALIPGRAAPVLITEKMVREMKPGAVIVDLAAGAGGNCTLSAPDERVTCGSVTILGPTNLPAALPVHASVMFARNALAFLQELIADGQVRVDMDNEIIRETLITHEGRVVKGPAPDAAGGGEEQS